MNRKLCRRGSGFLLLSAAGSLIALLGGCSGGSSGNNSEPPVAASLRVVDDSGALIQGATVYLVPAGDVDGSPITAADVLNGTSEDRDEPVEDQVRLNGAFYPHGVTDSNGLVFLPLIPTGDYFFHVVP